LVIVQLSLEVSEGLINNPVYIYLEIHIFYWKFTVAP
jgi:hypothetical protein